MSSDSESRKAVLHPASAIAGSPLRHVMGSVWEHLPVVVFLVALCVVLHHSPWYGWIEWLPVKLIASMTNPGVGRKAVELGPATGRIVAVVASRDFFASEFASHLPLERGKVAEMVDLVARNRPKLIALDIDTTPAGNSEAELQAWKRLVDTMRSALDEGIDVVAIAYPVEAAAPGGGERKRYLDELCRRLQGPMPPVERPVPPRADVFATPVPGRFALASPLVLPDGPFGVIYRVNDGRIGSGYETRLYHVIAAMMQPASLRGGRSAVASLCVDGRIDEKLLKQNDDALSDWHEASRSIRIRFTGDGGERYVTVLAVDSSVELRERAATLRDKVVLIGAQTYTSIDTFLTPVGSMSGAELHAHIANSADQPMAEISLFAVLLDVAIGLLFVAAYLLLRYLRQRMLCRLGPHCESLLMLMLPLIIFGSLLALAAYVSKEMFAWGYWLDPLPLFAGLALHLYVEASEGAHHASAAANGHGGGSHGLLAWLTQPVDEWKAARGTADPWRRIDTVVLGLVRLTMLGVVLWALKWIVFH